MLLHDLYIFFSFILLRAVHLTFPISDVCRASAEEAIQKMQGKMIGQQVIRVSWGRTLTARQVILPLEMAHLFTKCLCCSLVHL